MYSSNTETLKTLNSWPFVILFGCVLFITLIMQGIFNSISELYFPFAYEAIVFPYTIYAILFLCSNKASVDFNFNPLRPTLMAAAFLMLFTPAGYLLLTEQVDLHTMIFGDFNAELKHMPFAWLIPYLCIVALLVPLPSSDTFKKL